jgi:hypothetical protein
MSHQRLAITNILLLRGGTERLFSLLKVTQYYRVKAGLEPRQSDFNVQTHDPSDLKCLTIIVILIKMNIRHCEALLVFSNFMNLVHMFGKVLIS